MRLQKFYIFILLICMVFMQGCRQIEVNTEQDIKAPEAGKVAIEGTWKVTKYLHVNNDVSLTEDNEKYIGQTAAFDNSIAIFGDETCDSPEYKVKNVPSEEYLLYKYKTNANYLGIKSEKINVISITSKQQPFHDFIEISGSSLIAYVDEGFLFLNKISSNVDDIVKKKSLEKENKNKQESAIKDDPTQRSGVLLGLRYTKSDNSKETNSYRTIWIAAKSKEVRSIVDIKDLLVPRTAGFWQVGYSNYTKKGLSMGTLYAHPINSYPEEYKKAMKKDILEEYGNRKIIFVGNDYIGTEYSLIDKYTSQSTMRYQVLPMDNIGRGEGINISDVAGARGTDALIKSSEAFTLSQDKSKAEVLERYPSEDNFSLQRLNGQWIMKGRLNYTSSIEEKSFEDFNIYLSPPSKLITYDKLYVQWNDVKKKLPDALDVYTSPNKDIAIITTKDSIYVYNINKGLLADKPSRKITLNSGESVVMAEWATGKYVDRWDNIVKERGKNIDDISSNQ